MVQFLQRMARGSLHFLIFLDKKACLQKNPGVWSPCWQGRRQKIFNFPGEGGNEKKKTKN